MRGLAIGLGALAVFFLALEGLHRSVAEVGGIALADHALDFCPSWILGVGTGALGVGLCWWAVETARR